MTTPIMHDDTWQLTVLKVVYTYESWHVNKLSWSGNATTFCSSPPTVSCHMTPSGRAKDLWPASVDGSFTYLQSQAGRKGLKCRDPGTPTVLILTTLYWTHSFTAISPVAIYLYLTPLKVNYYWPAHAQTSCHIRWRHGHRDRGLVSQADVSAIFASPFLFLCAEPSCETTISLDFKLLGGLLACRKQAAKLSKNHNWHVQPCLTDYSYS